MPVLVDETPSGHFAAPEAGGEIGVAAGLVLHAAAAAAARHLDLTRRAIQTPVRSRSELLAELLMSDSAISEDLLARARQLGIPVSGWHLAVRVEADDLDEAENDEVRRFELLESAGQAALQAVSARLVTKSGPYEEQMFIDQLSNIGREISGADQKVGASYYERFNQLMKEWAALKGDAEAALR